MSTTIHTIHLKDQLTSLYRNNINLIRGNATPLINRLRNNAFAAFEKLGFPEVQPESWRYSDLDPLLQADFLFDFSNQSRSFDIERIFSCEVNDLDTFSVTLLNGWFVYKHAPLTRLPDGTVIGSLAKAMEVYPELVDAHLGMAANLNEPGGLTAMNTAFLQDGLFVYVPDGVKVEKPIQLINIVYSEAPAFLQPRHLIIAGKDAELNLVHCDHSLSHKISFTNTVAEIFAEEGAVVTHSKVQNKGRNSALITSTYFHQKANSRVSCNVITLNGGFTRNMIFAALTQPGCHSGHTGLYLVDRNQHIDNQVLIDHIAPDCTSDQLFKGILDDESKAVFCGKILVRKDAQRTRAYQNNKNLLLSDEAKAYALPHLEIYADDVKCSHGATIGQLDPDAMFYLRSRGLCELTARQLMMYAFAMEVIHKIHIEALENRLDNMVQKRLRGELSICDQCVIHCSVKEPATFNINLGII